MYGLPGAPDQCCNVMCCFCGRLRCQQGGTLTFWQQLGSRVQRLTCGLYAKPIVQQVKVGSDSLSDSQQLWGARSETTKL